MGLTRQELLYLYRAAADDSREPYPVTDTEQLPLDLDMEVRYEQTMEV